MLSQEVEEKLAERLVDRIEEANSYILKRIGEAIKQISTLTPSQAYQISQILKYGGTYNEIAKELARVSGKNVQDIYKIFEEVAKNNKQFAKQFYKYRGIDYIPYKKDIALQNMVKSLASITAGMYRNISNTSVIGFIQDGTFKQLQQVYQDTIDKAILSISQGKQDFYSSMRQTLKELGGSGLVQYESGRTRRLDSAVRMNILDGMRALNNETSRRFGEEYGSNMVEVSHHTNSAPDHIDTVDGKQFARIDVIRQQIASGIEKEIKLEDIQGTKVKVKGKWYDDYDTVNNSLDRKVSTLNCRHYPFEGILGVSKPSYIKEQIDADKKKNLDGFNFEGKHYTLYEGSQLCRRVELEIRKAKDAQILARASGDNELVEQSQARISLLTKKYNKLCQESGLQPKKIRMQVSGYKRVKT
jgi:uncharacterized protein with HEPN domain